MHITSVDIYIIYSHMHLIDAHYERRYDPIEAFSMTEISFTNEISVTKHDITGKVGEI